MNSVVLKSCVIDLATGRRTTLGDWELGPMLHESAATRLHDVRRRGSPPGASRYVAKILRGSATGDDRERFRGEVDAATTIADRHIVPALASELRREPFYYVMPKLEGATIAARLETHANSIAAVTALAWVRQTASGLAAMHAAGILHNDVCPRHIFVSRNGHATLIGLEGAAPNSEEIDCSRRCVLGDVEYLAPEAVCSRNRIDQRSDLYSLGVVLYRMLTGRLPLSGQSVDDVVTAIHSADVAHPRNIVASLPDDLGDFVLQLLHRQPLRRPQSAAEVVDRLTRFEIKYLHERA